MKTVYISLIIVLFSVLESRSQNPFTSQDFNYQTVTQTHNQPDLSSTQNLSGIDKHTERKCQSHYFKDIYSLTHQMVSIAQIIAGRLTFDSDNRLSVGEKLLRDFPNIISTEQSKVQKLLP